MALQEDAMSSIYYTVIIEYVLNRQNFNILQGCTYWYIYNPNKNIICFFLLFKIIYFLKMRFISKGESYM